jgi:hypothetical protein
MQISSKATRLAVLIIATLALLPTRAFAHDFFLLPASFNAGLSLELEATVGAAFPAAEIVVPEDRIAEARSSGGSQLRISGAGEHSLRLALTSNEPGAHVVAVRLHPRDVEYSEDRIPLILEEYEVAEAARAAVAALPAPRLLRASSQRFAKTIVCLETCAGRAHTAQAFGYPLEFVVDPTAPRRFVLLHEGEPLANYAVALARSSGRVHLATDEAGGVSLGDDIAGPVMLFAAHMSAPVSPQQRFQMLLTSLTAELN